LTTRLLIFYRVKDFSTGKKQPHDDRERNVYIWMGGGGVNLFDIIE